MRCAGFLIIFCITFAVQTEATTVHDGICPKTNGFGVCSSLCTSDANCTADQKCCSNGCGHSCMPSVKNVTLTPSPSATRAPLVHRGQCPVSSGGLVSICVDLCSSDANCTTDQKCCSNGCGHTCQKAKPIVHSGVCPIASGFGTCVTDCVDDQDCQTDEKCCQGSCGGYQCKSALPEVHDGVCPQSTGVGSCIEACSSDSACTAAAKCCSNGCGHSCMSAITATQPVPTTTIVYDGICPKPSGFGICISLCTSDANCTAGQKCCSNGCGHSCMPAVKNITLTSPPATTGAPLVHRGQCPVSSGGLFGACVELCSSDASCTIDQKCCSNGCGHNCQKSEQIVHSGVCPIVSGFGICVTDCVDDQDCQTDEKCCQGPCGGYQCKSALPEVHEGTCPQPTGFGLCIEACSNDASCAADQKCCSNGCGHSCMSVITATQPVTTTTIVRVHDGDCPKPSRVGNCSSLCKSDANCTADQKCCGNGCGHSCTSATDPVPTTTVAMGAAIQQASISLFVFLSAMMICFV